MSLTRTPTLRARLLAALLAPALQALAPFAATATHADDRTLTIITWSDFLDPALVTEFEAETGTRMDQVYIDSDDMRDALLVESNGEDFDLAFVDGVQLAYYRDQGWLQSFTAEEVPNLRHIDPVWGERYPASRAHALPFAWGTTGIAYRSDLVAKPMRSWADLFRPADALCGRIMMQDTAQDTVEMALRALGHDPGTDDPIALREAEHLMISQRECVLAYGHMNLDDHSELLSGRVWAAMTYNGDALMIQQHNPNVAFVVPDEGSELWMDFLVVFKQTRNKEAALGFMNFLAAPRHAARQALYSFYATPNLAAMRLLPEEFRSNPIIYPNADTLSRVSVDRAHAPRLARRHNQIMFRVLP